MKYVLTFLLLSTTLAAEPMQTSTTPAQRHIARAELALERLPESRSRR